MGTAPGKLICRRHYGFSWGLPFRENIDDEADAFLSFGTKMCAGWMKWMVKKVSLVLEQEQILHSHSCRAEYHIAILVADLGQGDEIDESTSLVFDVFRTWKAGQSYRFTDPLYSFSGDSSPDRDGDPGMFQYGCL